MVECDLSSSHTRPSSGIIAMSPCIADVMTWTSLTVRPDCTAREALNAMVAIEADEIFIVDQQDRFCGILTDYELLKAEVNGSLEESTVAGLMQRSTTALTPDQPLSTAISLFRDGRRARIPVIREGRLLGVIQRRDILRVLSDRAMATAPCAIAPPKFLQHPTGERRESELRALEAVR